jgi:hypothetical protein
MQWYASIARPPAARRTLLVELVCVYRRATPLALEDN